MAKTELTPAEAERPSSSRAEPTSRMRELEEAFEFRSPEEIAEYLGSRGSPSLVDLLLQVPARARSYFGPECRLVLDVCPDREGSGPPELFAYVVTDGSASEAWEQLLRLEDDWWLDAAGAEPVNLHVEFA